MGAYYDVRKHGVLGWNRSVEVLNYCEWIREILRAARDHGDDESSPRQKPHEPQKTSIAQCCHPIKTLSDEPTRNSSSNQNAAKLLMTNIKANSTDSC